MRCCGESLSANLQLGDYPALSRFDNLLVSQGRTQIQVLLSDKPPLHYAQRRERVVG
jgi:hypothetical protein